jgi:hypothetical protein
MGREAPGNLTWIWLLLAASALTLFFQLVPSAWSAVVWALDVRVWTWRAFAGVFAAAVVVLVAVRAWQNTRDAD